MKRLFTILGTILAANAAFAQGPADALMLAQNRYEGTARTMAMGNAFTALGGDLGAIAVNPASTGVYRCSEFSFSPAFITSKGQTDFNYSTASDKDTRFAVSNVGFVTTAETGRTSGILSYNFGFALNRINSFNNTIYANGVNSKASILGSIASGLNGLDYSWLEKTDSYEPYNNNSIPWDAILAYDCWLVSPEENSSNTYIGSTENYAKDGTIGVAGKLNQEFFSQTYGGANEITFNFAANANDNFYFGANLNLIAVDYVVNDYYSEFALVPGDFDDAFMKMEKSYSQNTSGAGFNAKFGAIYTPIAGLRLGATFTTPTWYSLTDSWNRRMTSEFTNGNYYSQSSPYRSYDYEITTPMRWSLGAAYTFGGLGLVSVDYEGVNYGAMHMADYYGSQAEFADANRQIRNGFGYASVIRAGAEFWLNSRVALRGGYNHYSTPGSLVDNNNIITYDYSSLDFVSGGLGFKLGDGRTSFDVAYQTMVNPEHQMFQAFDSYDNVSAPVIDLRKNISKLVFTLAVKF